ncbi:PDR/VanB family oxidoreductase [Streptomyces sp. NPDC004629]|uniref:PDR/VanB family oxidoreductase n=1 Tax=Streptomyces sp. NPDC004629 TaxID=3364705 RepID=UPI00367B478D
MARATPTLDLRVADRHKAADGVVALELVRLDGGELPAWEPGAHIDLHLKPGLTRQYSLCGDPNDRARWRIAVLREPEGRGGSAFVHDELVRDSVVTAGEPLNKFALEPASRYIFIAGGIGVTPILAMARSERAASTDWELHYGGRNTRSMAFTDEVVEFGGHRVTLYPQDQVGLLDLEKILAMPRPGTLVYCCGPQPLLDAVEQQCRTWPHGHLRVERFQPKDIADLTQDGNFEVELRDSRITVQVQAGESVLDAVRAAGVPVVSSCEEGTCGTCEVAVLEGEVEHRDSILSEDEQAANDTMFICVSRARCPRLVLDL